MLVDAQRAPSSSLDSGAAAVRNGTAADVDAFFTHFDTRTEERLHLADR